MVHILTEAQRIQHKKHVAYKITFSSQHILQSVSPLSVDRYQENSSQHSCHFSPWMLTAGVSHAIKASSKFHIP